MLNAGRLGSVIVWQGVCVVWHISVRIAVVIWKGSLVAVIHGVIVVVVRMKGSLLVVALREVSVEVCVEVWSGHVLDSHVWEGHVWDGHVWDGNSRNSIDCLKIY